MDHKNIYYRPHKAYLAYQCPSSMLRNPDFIPKTKAGMAADLGTACHELFKSHVVPRYKIEDNVIAEVAERHNVAVDGFDGLAWRARKLEEAYAKMLGKGFFQSPTTEEKWEVALENGYQFSCYADLYELHGNWGVVAELKMGKVDTGWEEQAIDYAMYMMKRFRDQPLEKFFTVIIAPVQDYYSVKSYTRAQLEEREQLLISQMLMTGKQYVTGKGCQYCENLFNCPGIKRMIDPISEDIMKAGGRKDITGADIQKWRPVIKAMGKICDAYDECEKMLLEQAGTIDLGDGNELYLREQYKKDIDVGKAITVMCDQFKVSKADFIAKVEIGTGAIEELSRLTAPKGGIDRQKKAVWLAMKESGAMIEKLQKVKATRKSTKKIGE